MLLALNLKYCIPTPHTMAVISSPQLELYK